ncbi:MAG: alpha/beta fold hydrolase [Proteobacteria bacterium]|nr:MAG: alpha/beta fold hydrolase [Pseudomonadota bacterium]
MHLSIDGRTAFVYTGARPFEPARPSVVFVHGAAMDHTVWVLPARYFARHGVNVLAVDLPGHGRSEGKALDRIESMSDWLVRVLDAAGVEDAAMVGHSMGSLAVLDAARRHPSRVRSLALVGSAVPMAVSDPLLDASRANSHDAIDMLTYWGYSRGAQLGGNETPGMWMVGGTLRLLERAAPGVLHTGLAACNDYRIDPGSASPVDVRALLILGDKDIMTPSRHAATLTAMLPNVSTAVLKGSGHSLMMERPAELLDALIPIV